MAACGPSRSCTSGAEKEPKLRGVEVEHRPATTSHRWLVDDLPALIVVVLSMGMLECVVVKEITSSEAQSLCFPRGGPLFDT